MRRLAIAFALLAACGRRDTPSSAGDGGAVALASAFASASASASASPSAPATPAAYEGTYTATAGSLYAPDLEGYPKWRGDEASVGLGEGTLTFTVDAASGHLIGKGDGALGPLVLSGLVGDDGFVSFALVRADPRDGGFTGAALGKLDGGKIAGTLRASLALGNVLREASFTMSKK